MNKEIYNKGFIISLLLRYYDVKMFINKNVLVLVGILLVVGINFGVFSLLKEMLCY